MIPDQQITVVDGDGIFIGTKKLSDGEIDDLKQQAVEIKNMPIFELLIGHEKAKAYSEGFLLSLDWNATLSGKAWHGAALDIENIIQKIIDFKKTMV